MSSQETKVGSSDQPTDAVFSCLVYCGLGGEPITLKEFYFIREKLKGIAESRRLEKPVYWLGFEE